MRLKLRIRVEFLCLHDAISPIRVFFGEMFGIDGYILLIGMLHEYVIDEAFVLMLTMQLIHTLLEPFLQRHLDFAANALHS